MSISKIRTFIAIPIPRQVIEKLSALQKSLKSLEIGKIRWVRPDNMHLTLKFLGDINPNAVDGISASIAEAAAGQAPISICAEKVGVFPNIKRPKVIWAGIGGEGNAIADLHQRIDDGLARMGIAPEKRSFNSHLTLGRFKEYGHTESLTKVLEQNNTFRTEMAVIDRAVFFKSILKPDGPTYIKLATFQFT